MLESDITDSLNTKQKGAVLSRNKHTLVLAGAGSGKTKVLISRIAYLISLNVDPDAILAVTFTNKAAKEMKNRVSKIIPSDINLNNFWIGTFHGICNKIILQHHSLLNLPKNYLIIDGEGQKSLVRRSFEEIEKINNTTYDKKEVIPQALDFINKAKENGLRPKDSHDFLISKGLEKMFLQIYTRYEEIRIISNVIDYGDMLLMVLELFKENIEVKNHYKSKFSHVLVDEYQDTNAIQEKLIKIISSDDYLFVVGDDDQSIYGWRGAKVDNILKFGDRYNDVNVIKLEQNYRSTKKILNAANAVIEKNIDRLGKNLWSDKELGSNILIIEADRPEDESSIVADIIKHEISSNNVSPSDIAILYRSNAISRSFESKFTDKKIPYKLVGGLSFWERSEVKDLLAYLDLILNTTNDISFERVINKPSRKIGKASLSKIRDYAYSHNISMFESLERMIDEKLIKSGVALASSKFVNSVLEIRGGDLSETVHLLVIKIIESFNIYETYIKEDDESRDRRKDNIQELAYFAQSFTNDDESISNLQSFLSHAKLQSDVSKDSDVSCVELLTLHASKGLEYPLVFIVGMEDGVFPSSRSINSKKALEEERRLAYVGITRAERKLHISYSGFRYNNPQSHSRFLRDLPLDILDFKSRSSYNISPLGRKILSNSDVKKAKNSAMDIKYNIGSKMKHPDFGLGEVIDKTYGENGTICIVDFGFIGRKKISLN